MATVIQIKSVNPKIKQIQVAKELGYSSRILQRYRNFIIMLSPYRLQPNITNKRRQNKSPTELDDNSHRKRDLKRPQKN